MLFIRKENQAYCQVPSPTNNCFTLNIVRPVYIRAVKLSKPPKYADPNSQVKGADSTDVRFPD